MNRLQHEDYELFVNWGNESARLDAMTLVGNIGDLEFDIQNGVVVFPVTVLTTVGITQVAYDRLEILGAILSVLIGAGVGGWLLKKFNMGQAPTAPAGQ